jgi:hypothetical protein
VGQARGQDGGGARVPDYLGIVAGNSTTSGTQALAEKNVLTLDTAMMAIYEDSLTNFKRNLKAQRPIILALFSEGGGRMILYRPGQEPLEAPPVPLRYQLAKAVSHSGMALYAMVSPYLRDPSDKAWQGPMRTFRVQCQTALECLPEVDLTSDQRELLATILKRDLAFMDECLARGTFTSAQVEAFTRGVAPYFGKTIALAAEAQVGHWMGVLAGWKAMLGDDWDRTYAASNALFVARQNNILFTVLAQFMGREAIGERLLLFETSAFTTTPDQLFDVLCRVVSDRSLGQAFFKDYYLMDVELLGGGARKVIEKEALKRGMTPLLPPMAPFHSNDWPWRTDPTKGTGPSSLEEVK